MPSLFLLVSVMTDEVHVTITDIKGTMRIFSFGWEQSLRCAVRYRIDEADVVSISVPTTEKKKNRRRRRKTGLRGCGIDEVLGNVAWCPGVGICLSEV
jgi:hypothetical protein